LLRFRALDPRSRRPGTGARHRAGEHQRRVRGELGDVQRRHRRRCASRRAAAGGAGRALDRSRRRSRLERGARSPARRAVARRLGSHCGPARKAAAFRQMHREPPLLVLPNAWDVASAKALAALNGCRALATTSAAVARSLGWEDGEQAPVAEMIESARRIAAAVDVPVTADLERGYGDPVGTARAAWEAGLVGINFEDSTRAGLVVLD